MGDLTGLSDEARELILRHAYRTGTLCEQVMTRPHASEKGTELLLDGSQMAFLVAQMLARSSASIKPVARAAKEVAETIKHHLEERREEKQALRPSYAAIVHFETCCAVLAGDIPDTGLWDGADDYDDALKNTFPASDPAGSATGR